jgi:hypothetical protein
VSRHLIPPLPQSADALYMSSHCFSGFCSVVDPAPTRSFLRFFFLPNEYLSSLNMCARSLRFLHFAVRDCKLPRSLLSRLLVCNNANSAWRTYVPASALFCTFPLRAHYGTPAQTARSDFHFAADIPTAKEPTFRHYGFLNPISMSILMLSQPKLSTASGPLRRVSLIAALCFIHRSSQLPPLQDVFFVLFGGRKAGPRCPTDSSNWQGLLSPLQKFPIPV